MSITDYMDSRVLFAPEGGCCVVNTTNASQTEFDLTDTDFLGELATAGVMFTMISSVNCWVKFSQTGATNLDPAARSVASLGGGAAQGVFLPADTYVRFFIPQVNNGAPMTTLHVQNTAATGFLCIFQSSQDTQ